MLTLSEYTNLVEQGIKSIEYPAQPAGLYVPIQYTLDGGGKRLRSSLTLAVCDAFGAEPATALNQALAVEMFHNFTLLHDDVMDNAEMRRGRPTVHVKWDDRTAILSGDAMLTLSMMLAVHDCPADKLASVVRLLNRTAMEVYQGQQYDMDFESRKSVTVEEYIEMIRLKTSVLLGCACSMGALMAGADRKSKQAMFTYGERLGLAFQLQDDYLDTFGDPIIFGKEIGGDIVNDKKTWLLITALEEDNTGVVRHQIEEPSDDDEKIEAVRDVYVKLNLPQRCNALIERYLQEAIDALEDADLTPGARKFFADLALSTRNRTH